MSCWKESGAEPKIRAFAGATMRPLWRRSVRGSRKRESDGVKMWSEFRKALARAAKALAAASVALSAAQAQPRAQTQPAPQAQPARPAPQAAPRVRHARPAMWRVADEDTTIYLFGTIHALPAGIDWHTPAFDRAMAGADELVLELPPGDLGAGAQAAMLAHGFADGLPPILERVPEDRREALAQAIRRSGVPMAQFDRMKTWLAGTLLAVIGFQHIGIEGAEGVEHGLTDAAGTKPVTGLETAAQQIGYLDSLSEESQRAMLVAATEPDGTDARDFQTMLDAWAGGDTAAIARTFNADDSVTPELKRVLLTERNARWASWVQHRLDRPGTVFVAVGAGHLAGEESVVADLAERGVEVERMQ